MENTTIIQQRVKVKVKRAARFTNDIIEIPKEVEDGWRIKVGCEADVSILKKAHKTYLIYEFDNKDLT